MSEFLKFVFDNWLWLVLGGATAWVASLAVPQSAMPATKLVFRVIGRLGLSVPLAIVIGGPLALFLSFMGGGAGPLLACLLGVPILAFWALFPLLGPPLDRYLSGAVNAPTRDPKDIVGGDPEA